MYERLSAKEREERALAYWAEHRVFERSIEERPKEKPYAFYDGPPFATGLPHYGHMVGSVLKDVVPRFWTMRGYRVPRVWGWDCHGLPIENIIEKELNLGSRKAIEAFGIAAFNDACRSKVLEYAGEWKKVIHRLGRWVDMENAYHTMDRSYMESVWWVFKSLWEKGMIYEGWRPMHICPRCATTLSASEVSSTYQDVDDIAVTVRFPLVDDPSTALLAWTTTPWTLPANQLLAVGADITYVKVRQGNGYVVVAEDCVANIVEGEAEIVERISGRDFVGRKYIAAFPYFANENGFRVVTADFVATGEGTGIVHIAPGFGEDDFAVGDREGLDMIRHITIDGTFIPEVTDFAGKGARASNGAIVEWLAGNGRIYRTAKIKHSYPVCWRCDTPLLNYATGSWFVAVSRIREDLLKNNEQISWVPESMKDGRFGMWLSGARDWSISRNRYWGAPLPVWRADDGDVLVFGSAQELEEACGQNVPDLHKQFVDALVVRKNGKEYRRVSEVLDCWFESGSMPYGQVHYPFEHKEDFEAAFPAEFIAEGQDQTRGWFYTLHVLSTILFGKPAFRHVVVNGIVLAEDGKKMSKKLKNYPDPMQVIESYGADALRAYLMSTPVTRAEMLRFSELGVKEISNKLLGTLGNIVSFYRLFVRGVPHDVDREARHVLDCWALARVERAVGEATSAMEQYEISAALRVLQECVTDMSQWYVRRSRDRFKADGSADMAAAARTLFEVLDMLARALAPFVPFMAEHVWQEVHEERTGKSVHLAAWPHDGVTGESEHVLGTMAAVRAVVSRALEARQTAKLPVRQVLQTLTIGQASWFRAQCGADMAAYTTMIAEEVNVLEVVWVDEEGSGEVPVTLDTVLTPDLVRRGLARETIRTANDLRKAAGLTIHHTVELFWESASEEAAAMWVEHGGDIAKRVHASKVSQGSLEQASHVSEPMGGDAAMRIGLRVVSMHAE